MEDSIALSREAVGLLSPDHPRRSGALTTLGTHLLWRFEQTHQIADLEASVTSYREAIKWASTADAHSHQSALDAYQYAIGFLPRMTMHSYDLKTRQKYTAAANGVAGSAASCAIRAGQLDKAVEFLEEGRTVFWSQALQLRPQWDDLHSVEPFLAIKLRNISEELEKARSVICHTKTRRS